MNGHDEALPGTHRRTLGTERPPAFVAVANTQVRPIGAAESDVVDRPDQLVLFFDPLQTEPLPLPGAHTAGIDRSPSAVDRAQVAAVVGAQRDHGTMLVFTDIELRFLTDYAEELGLPPP